MTWIHIFRKEIADSIRSKSLWALTVVFSLLVAGASVAPALVSDGSSPPEFGVGIGALWAIMAPIVPLIGLLIGYNAIIGERESGRIRFLLGLPNSRLDVVVGKVLGRFGLVSIATVIAFAVGTVVLIGLYDGFAPGEYAVVGVGMILFALAFVALGISISAVVGSSRRGVASVFGVYVLLAVIWDYVPVAVYWVANGSLPTGSSRPAWFALLELLTPGTALFEFTFANLDSLNGGEYASVESVAAQVAGDVPFYLSSWFAAIVFAAWIIVPLTVAYSQFRTAVIS